MTQRGLIDAAGTRFRNYVLPTDKQQINLIGRKGAFLHVPFFLIEKANLMLV